MAAAGSVSQLWYSAVYNHTIQPHGEEAGRRGGIVDALCSVCGRRATPETHRGQYGNMFINILGGLALGLQGYLLTGCPGPSINHCSTQLQWTQAPRRSNGLGTRAENTGGVWGQRTGRMGVMWPGSTNLPSRVIPFSSATDFIGKYKA